MGCKPEYFWVLSILPLLCTSASKRAFSSFLVIPLYYLVNLDFFFVFFFQNRKLCSSVMQLNYIEMTSPR